MSRLYQWMTKILKLLFGNCRILTSNASISWTSRLKTLYLYKVSSRMRYFFRFPRKILQNDRWNLVWTWNFNSDEFLAIFSTDIKSHIFFSVNSAKKHAETLFLRVFHLSIHSSSLLVFSSSNQNSSLEFWKCKRSNKAKKISRKKNLERNKSIFGWVFQTKIYRRMRKRWICSFKHRCGSEMKMVLKAPAINLSEYANGICVVINVSVSRAKDVRSDPFIRKFA